MKTKKVNTLKILVIAAAALMLGMASFSVGANEQFSGTGSAAQVIYQPRSINHSIYSYLSRMAGEISLEPKLIYVSQANGPSIYSYAHSNSEKTVPWNVEYVDTAYGQAIYSYERHQIDGEVNVLPIVTD